MFGRLGRLAGALSRRRTPGAAAHGPMRSADAEARLRRMLQDAGVDVEHPVEEDVQRTWDVVRSFAAIPAVDVDPADPEGDRLLAQYGVRTWWGPEQFDIDISRQFLFEEGTDDEPELRVVHLRCTFEFEVTDELRALGSDDRWSTGMDLDAFFADVSAMPGFRAVRERRPAPRALRVEYEDW